MVIAKESADLILLEKDLMVLEEGVIVGLPPGVRQTDKTQFAVRCKILDRQNHFIAF